MTEHVWEVHENCDRLACNVCEGGLSICTVCGLIEGSLTTDCPGKPSYAEHGDDIYAGRLDFRNGEWVYDYSPHCPAGYSLEKLNKGTYKGHHPFLFGKLAYLAPADKGEQYWMVRFVELSLPNYYCREWNIFHKSNFTLVPYKRNRPANARI